MEKKRAKKNTSRKNLPALFDFLHMNLQLAILQSASKKSADKSEPFHDVAGDRSVVVMVNSDHWNLSSQDVTRKRKYCTLSSICEVNSDGGHKRMVVPLSSSFLDKATKLVQEDESFELLPFLVKNISAKPEHLDDSVYQCNVCYSELCGHIYQCGAGSHVYCAQCVVKLDFIATSNNNPVAPLNLRRQQNRRLIFSNNDNTSYESREEEIETLYSQMLAEHNGTATISQESTTTTQAIAAQSQSQSQSVLPEKTLVGSFTCPHCKQICVVQRNRILEQILQPYVVKCSNYLCDATAFSFDESIHKQECMYRAFNCPFCSDTIPSFHEDDIEYHFTHGSQHNQFVRIYPGPDERLALSPMVSHNQYCIVSYRDRRFYLFFQYAAPQGRDSDSAAPAASAAVDIWTVQLWDFTKYSNNTTNYTSPLDADDPNEKQMYELLVVYANLPKLDTHRTEQNKIWIRDHSYPIEINQVGATSKSESKNTYEMIFLLPNAAVTLPRSIYSRKTTVYVHRDVLKNDGTIEHQVVPACIVKRSVYSIYVKEQNNSTPYNVLVEEIGPGKRFDIRLR